MLFAARASFATLVLAAVSGAQVIESGRFAANQITGLFCAVEVNVTGSRRVDTRTWLFLPGNRISSVYPFGGVFDPARCSGDTCGTYTIGSGQISVRWDGGRVDQLPLELAGEDSIRLNGKLFRPARVVTSESLVGRWGDASSNIYTFDANGRFNFGTGSSLGLGGAYRVQGFTLILSFSDGDVRRRALFGTSATGEPLGMISVDREVFARK